MTRRGSLTYYLAAVVVGCFFVSVAYALFGQVPRWHGDPEQVSSFREFFLLYFLSIPFGGFSALVFAFVLRRLAPLLRPRSSVAWVAAGAVLAPAVMWAFVVLAEAARIYGGAGRLSAAILAGVAWVCLGPIVLSEIWWVVVPAGMATALVLCAIHRAFEPRESTAI
jgi:hypothetical protein